MNYISTTSLFKKAWETVKTNLFKIVGATLVLFIIQSVLDKATRVDRGVQITPDVGIGAFLATVLSFVVGVAITAAIIRVARGEEVTTRVFSLTFSQALRYFGVVVLVMLIMLAFTLPVIVIAFALGIFSLTSFPVDLTGEIIAFALATVVAIIGFIYVNMRLMLATYLVVDTDAGVVAALKQSWALTRGEVWTIVKLAALSIFVVLLGALALVIGLLVAIPVVAFTYAHLYLALTARNQVVGSSTHNE